MAIGTGTALALGGAAMAGQGVSMYSQYENAKYNADLAESAGRAQSEATQMEARRLADEQSAIKASQRVALASGGGGVDQEQPLMILADQANKMQLDQLELARQAQIARQSGSQQSLISRMQGRAGLLSGAGRLAGTGLSLYGAYSAGQPSGGGGVDQSVPSRELAAQRLGLR